MASRKTPAPRKSPTPAPAKRPRATSAKKTTAAATPPRETESLDPIAPLRAFTPPLAPARVHQHFETLRDRTQDPHALFALAVAEARALDELCGNNSDASGFNRALTDALARVLEGPADGIESAGLAWSLDRAEALLRAAGPRKLDAASQAHTLRALARGRALAGDQGAAQKALARWVHHARVQFEQDATRWGEFERALAYAWEASAAARDAKSMIAWARARADAESLRPGGSNAAAKCEALSALPALWAELDDAEKSFDAAEEWIDAEREAASSATRPVDRRRRRAGLLDALRARTAAAREMVELARGNKRPAALARFVEAARDWAHGAREAVLAETTSRGDAAFALARLSEALGALTEAEAVAGDLQRAIAHAREWLAAERAAAGDKLSDGCLTALTALGELSQGASPALRALAADGVLESLAGLGPEADAARAQAAAESTRAYLAQRKYRAAAERAREWMSLPGVSGGTNAAVARVILARCEEAVEALARPKPRGKNADAVKKPAALVAVETAAQARDEFLAGAQRSAAKRADEAMDKLKAARGAPTAVRDYVHFVHECARPGEVTAGGVECAARALAALEAGDTARALRLLGAIRWEKSKVDECSLAHVLAACVALCEQLAPGDAVVEAGRQAFAEVEEHAVLGSLSPR